MIGKFLLARTPGFTLIELLVVLVIMALFVGLVTAIVQPDDRALLRVETERLAQLLDLAAQESRLTGNSIAWISDGAGYRFWRLSGETEWSELRDNDLLRARKLPNGMLVAGLEIENMPATAGMRLEFPPYATPVAFRIEMSLGTERYAVAASPIGDLQVVPVAGESHGGLAQQ